MRTARRGDPVTAATFRAEAISLGFIDRESDKMWSKLSQIAVIAGTTPSLIRPDQYSVARQAWVVAIRERLDEVRAKMNAVLGLDEEDWDEPVVAAPPLNWSAGLDRVAQPTPTSAPIAGHARMAEPFGYDDLSGLSADSFWSTTNLAEALPGVPTPLSWTLWRPVLEVSIRGAFGTIGALERSRVVDPAERRERLFDLFHGRAAGRIDFFRDG